MIPGRILVVDDDLMMRRMIVQALAPDRHTIVEAPDGASAVRLALAETPDVILLDVIMPGMSGHDVCKQLRGDPRTADVPIIFVTSLVTESDLQLGYAAGPDEILAKPPTPLELRARVRAMLRLKRYGDEARALLKHREALTEFLVHDLRNPLMTIMANCHILSSGRDPLTPAQSARLRGIEAAYQRIEGYCCQLLATSRLEAGAGLAERVPCDLVMLVREAMCEQEPLARDHTIRVALECAAASLVVTVDVELVKRLVENLLVNALKYSPPSSQVTIRLHPLAGGGNPRCTAQISVLDEGPGIAPEHREHIFDKYGVVAAKRACGLQIGLGLYFCRLVAEAHGGRIWVEANHPYGSIFGVEI